MNPSTPNNSFEENAPSSLSSADAATFWRLAESFRPYLQTVAARLLGGRLAGKVDAADVVQQCLLTAFQHFAQFRGQDAGQWQSWLRTLVKNQAHKLVRFWRQERRDVGRERSLDAGAGTGWPLVDDSSGPSGQAVRREQATRMMAAIERLPADYQQVIQLRIFEDLAFAVVAARMNRSEAAVRKLWERAVKQLAAEWGDDA
jgi:RNA polymerase sigma-70 factor (ECF subfamily)